jgi:succinate-semialdehyde dehydrogenase/glutarate-semialdehyde dehydrogenase
MYRMSSDDASARLRRVATAVQARRAELISSLLSVETAATAQQELEWVVAGLRPDDSTLRWMRARSGVGTVFVALPATLPMYSLLLFALAPAAVGNTVVVRPSSVSRPCVELFAGIAAEAGMTVEVVAYGWEEFAGDATSNAEGMVYCGSADHAAALDARLPETVTLVCQSQGVCASVVTASADVERAADEIVTARLFNNGQDCLATERVYVAEEVYGEFLAAVLRAAECIHYGENDDAGADVGPLLLPHAASQWLDEPSAHGKVLHHGRRDGNVFRLAVIEASPDSPVVLEETYCPILPIVRYRTTRELKDMLSLGDFSLGISVYGSTERTDTLDFSQIAIDEPLYCQENAWAPFGGHRRTTLLRHDRIRKSGPVLVPFVMSESA